MKRKSIHYFRISLVASVAIHLITVLAIHLAKNMNVQKKPDQIEVVLIDNSSKTKQQIVEQNDKTLNDEINKNAKYLSKNNQSVLEETRAAQTGDFNNVVNPGMRGTKEKSKAPKKITKKSTTQGELPSLDALKPKMDFNPPKEDEIIEASTGQVARTNDHLKDQQIGMQTLLNTREFVYFSYYQRIRTKIRQFWEPSIREKVRRIFAQGRNIASTRDRVTRVIIVLNKEGTLVKVQIVGRSGITDLDDAAVEAFKDAAPFPNPPKDIVEPDGTIKIHWDFILEAFVPPKSNKNHSFSRLTEKNPYIS